MEKDLGRIKKNETSDIVVRIDDFGGKTGLTIREFVKSEKYTGFTKSGVRIPASEFLNFREMINSVSLNDLKESESPKKEEDNEQEELDY
jgi:DNA helicase TIP49 (TBP-interacting protein)